MAHLHIAYVIIQTPSEWNLLLYTLIGYARTTANCQRYGELLKRKRELDHCSALVVFTRKLCRSPGTWGIVESTLGHLYLAQEGRVILYKARKRCSEKLSQSKAWFLFISASSWWVQHCLSRPCKDLGESSIKPWQPRYYKTVSMGQDNFSLLRKKGNILDCLLKSPIFEVSL